MVLGKVFKAWYKVDKDSVYSLLLEKRNDKSQALLFEADLIATLSAQETESVKHLYTAKSDAYGCLGVLHLAVGDSSHLLFLVLINSCISIGKIDKSEIFRITDTTFISLRNNPTDNDKIYEIRRILNSGTFYFSWTPQEDEKPFDLTLSVQRQLRSNQTDNRFFWNRAFHLHFLRFGVNTDRWLVKAICGDISISTVYVGHQQARACLISRLSSERAGTRFNVRGVDDNGNVANFVETEQSIFLESKVSSYVILRGSVPLFWEQPGINLGSHKIKISRGNEVSQPAYNRHIAMLKRRYGKCVIINLMGSKEGEAMLSAMFKAHHKSCSFAKDIPFIEFDYHAQCPRGKQENLSKVLEADIKNYMSDFGFFSSGNNVMVNSQTGCFRINCVDCLDRTNSVKTYICLEVLKQQLAALMISDKSTIVSRFEETFRKMWAINGDQISRIYAGTGALEGKSKIKDSTLSVKRSFQNNLLDSSKQEAFDVLLTGRTLNNEYSDRARALLPSEYLNLSNNILISLCDRYLEYTNPTTIKVVVGTWNVNGGKHFNTMAKKTEPLSDWLLDYKKKSNEINIMDLSLNNSIGELSEANAAADIFAIGFEEIVDLNASNIVAASTTNQREWLKELQTTISRDNSYVLVSKVQLVGVCLFVFVQPCHALFIREVSVDQVKTGLGGATGNKGGVAIRMLFYNTSLCFVCAHFAAGQNQYQDRNADYAEITRKINFPSNRSLNSHDYIFWCGDFNYRIDLENEQVKEYVKTENWPALLAYDQLLTQQSNGKVFRNYIEGEINFAPTYKYDIDSEVYDSSEKFRVPAYTDRILFKKKYPTRLGEDPLSLNYGKVLFYGRCELKTSDHRPVIGEYNIEILKVDTEARKELFRIVVESLGPQDATVIVKHKLGISGFDDSIVSHILKIFSDEGGEIVLARYSLNFLFITFRESISALRVVRNCSNRFLNEDISIELKTPNWIELIKNEMNLATDNTIPLQEQSDNSVYDFDYSSNFEENYTSSTSGLDDEIDIVLPTSNQINSGFTSSSWANELLDRPPPLPDRLAVNQIPSRPPPPLSVSAVSKAVPPPKPPLPVTQQTGSAKPKLVPVRPAPLPPSKVATNEQRNRIDTEFNFNMPPPDIPAPALPDDHEEHEDNESFDYSNDYESQPPPPLPPPRIDSFENSQNEEEPSSPWQTLPPAPPLPPLDKLDNPPPIPMRPKAVLGSENVDSSTFFKPPPIPARPKLTTGQPSSRKAL